MKERERLKEADSGKVDWRGWGPYLSERQWGTVREDYSPNGTAWDYFTHDHARSRAYRWGEDGIGGFSDNHQRICLAPAFWNGKDPILKERLFGLTNSEGNHGEDVKEIYYYLDATPTHSYLKALYKYPQKEFPYSELVKENRRRSNKEPEFELIDTGVFGENRYFDLFVEYAKADPKDILMQVTAINRGPEAASIHVLSQLWFRNTWAWAHDSEKPSLERISDSAVRVQHPLLGEYMLSAEGHPSFLFCDNDTNVRRLFGEEDATGYFKDAFHEYLIDGNAGAVNPSQRGTKCAAHFPLTIPAGAEVKLRLRLAAGLQVPSFRDFDEILGSRREESDEFYADLQCNLASEEEQSIQRQALSGMVWSKQYFHYNVSQWLEGDPTQPPPPPERKRGRNHEWTHLNNADIVSMPDKWEYPWYAAWDLAFHAVALSVLDPGFAKQQLMLMTQVWYIHPNGQLPAYEWAFGDVNPPVHAWAAWRVFQIDRKSRREERPDDPGDLFFLRRVFHKLLLNFTWWVNRKDADGRNIFQGGFLGLDNIGVFDRSAPLPTGGYINQSDGTSWMAMYCLNLMRIALELASHDHVYEDIATKFFEHFLQIAEAMTNLGEGIGLWDDADGFFYDVLNMPNGTMIPLKVRSMVGLIPLFAVETLEPDLLDTVPEFKKNLEWYLLHRPDLAQLVSRWHIPGQGDRRLLSLLRGHRMKKVLRHMLDESEFLADYGIRALSRYHLEHPYQFHWADHTVAVQYEAGESTSVFFGGNSNWRGPIWFPVNFLIIESLQKFHYYYGDEFKIECPTGSGIFLTINEVAAELGRRLARLFLRGKDDRRPVYGQNEVFQSDPNFREYIHFFEYFDGDTGRGIGASHQTGWTGLIAKVIHPRVIA
jgi:mannosylglycerate hydrolase MGH1-like protein